MDNNTKFNLKTWKELRRKQGHQSIIKSKFKSKFKNLVIILFLIHNSYIFKPFRKDKVSDMLENETKKMEEKLELVKKMMDLEKNKRS
jgi:hypothetical protein